ncbi:hypothetical protein PR048_020477 [Dryococelus australis]|uniref:Uncharacterized protein n=1 Tax=Dryococelus australis TaxID=614101 RepID=A0ABQ9H6D8_9NEOP|nr:hypothetical protein PR048_020477 [Dryococelus australis]
MQIFRITVGRLCSTSLRRLGNYRQSKLLCRQRKLLYRHSKLLYRQSKLLRRTGTEKEPAVARAEDPPQHLLEVGSNPGPPEEAHATRTHQCHWTATCRDASQHLTIQPLGNISQPAAANQTQGPFLEPRAVNERTSYTIVKKPPRYFARARASGRVGAATRRPIECISSGLGDVSCPRHVSQLCSGLALFRPGGRPTLASQPPGNKYSLFTVNAGMKGRQRREITEKIRRPRALSGTIPTCKNPVTRPGIEYGSPLFCLPHRDGRRSVVEVTLDRKLVGRQVSRGAVKMRERAVHICLAQASITN